jgi:hypothetical protein
MEGGREVPLLPSLGFAGRPRDDHARGAKLKRAIQKHPLLLAWVSVRRASSVVA